MCFSLSNVPTAMAHLFENLCCYRLQKPIKAETLMSIGHAVIDSPLCFFASATITIDFTRDRFLFYPTHYVKLGEFVAVPVASELKKKNKRVTSQYRWKLSPVFRFCDRGTRRIVHSSNHTILIDNFQTTIWWTLLVCRHRRFFRLWYFGKYNRLRERCERLVDTPCCIYFSVVLQFKYNRYSMPL